MKCPKCGYLGFETVDRCRNCGYDFSLSTQTEAPVELPLQQREAGGVPLDDFEFGPRDIAADAGVLDLDRVFGATSTPVPTPTPDGSEKPTIGGLPLFAPEHGDGPLITTPRPVRPPLSVRRATPDVPRVRQRAPRPKPDEAALDLDLESVGPIASPIETRSEPQLPTALVQAGRFARLFAGLVDLVLLGAIDAAVVYLTLAVAGVPSTQIQTLYLVPLIAFVLLLNGGYLVAFTVASGQTIGKMLTGIRVVTDDGGRVTTGGAVVRAIGCLLSVLTIGLGYLPALVARDARALQDRLARTRVVRNQ